jgi:hypothetical protein
VINKRNHVKIKNMCWQTGADGVFIPSKRLAMELAVASDPIVAGLGF